jgi:hypothetical protein
MVGPPSAVPPWKNVVHEVTSCLVRKGEPGHSWSGCTRFPFSIAFLVTSCSKNYLQTELNFPHRHLSGLIDLAEAGIVS